MSIHHIAGDETDLPRLLPMLRGNLQGLFAFRAIENASEHSQFMKREGPKVCVVRRVLELVQTHHSGVAMLADHEAELVRDELFA